MDFDTFQQLPTSEVAQLVRAAGPQVCGFPINGTRRWFFLEHPELAEQGLHTYLDVTTQKHIDMYRLLFDHGVDTLLTPIIGPDILERDEEYQKLVEPGLLWFVRDPRILGFYEAYDVRVKVYGEAHRYFAATPLAHLLDAFAEIADRTAHHRSRRLFLGVCAHDPAETVAKIGVEFRAQHGRLPTKPEIVAAYYGEDVEPLSFFIGFERPAVFDMPLISTGTEDLYFTVSPSLYLEAPALRAILYDHLYTRRITEDYATFSAADWRALGEFYRLNRGHVLGVGRQYDRGKFWYPLPQVILLPAFLTAEK